MMDATILSLGEAAFARIASVVSPLRAAAPPRESDRNLRRGWGCGFIENISSAGTTDLQAVHSLSLA